MVDVCTWPLKRFSLIRKKNKPLIVIKSISPTELSVFVTFGGSRSTQELQSIKNLYKTENMTKIKCFVNTLSIFINIIHILKKSYSSLYQTCKLTHLNRFAKKCTTMGKRVVDPRLKEHMPIIPVCNINTIHVDKFIVVWRMLKKQKHYIFTAKICSSLRQVIQYIPRNMHTVFALLCFVVVIHWLIFPYPSGLLHWHCGNLTIAPVPAKQPWWIWINTSCEFIKNDCITTTKQSTTKPRAYFLGYTVFERGFSVNVTSKLQTTSYTSKCYALRWSRHRCWNHTGIKTNYQS